MDLASALDTAVSDLLDPTPPSPRDSLEISLIRSQETALFESLELPRVKPGAKMDTQTLTHIVGLHEACETSPASTRPVQKTSVEPTAPFTSTSSTTTATSPTSRLLRAMPYRHPATAEMGRSRLAICSISPPHLNSR